MSYKNIMTSSKVATRIEALSEVEAHYETIINGGGQYSTRADELISKIKSDGLARAILVGVWLFMGLVVNFLVLLPRFAWITMVILPIVFEVIIVFFAGVHSWFIWIFLCIEAAAGLAPAIPLTMLLAYRTIMCIASGSHCPVDDDSQIKRGFELLADVMITLYTIRVCVMLVGLGLGYQRAEDEQERADDIRGKMV
jgi:hypothetical protein